MERRRVGVGRKFLQISKMTKCHKNRKMAVFFQRPAVIKFGLEAKEKTH